MHLPIEALKLIQSVFWSTFIALHHPFMFKYQVEKEEYKKVSNPKPNLLYIGLPVERYGEAIIWPIVGGGFGKCWHWQI